MNVGEADQWGCSCVRSRATPSTDNRGAAKICRGERLTTGRVHGSLPQCGNRTGVVLIGDSFYLPPYQYRARCIPDPEWYGESHGGPRPRSVLEALLDGNPSVEWSGPSSECV